MHCRGWTSGLGHAQTEQLQWAAQRVPRWAEGPRRPGLWSLRRTASRPSQYPWPTSPPSQTSTIRRIGSRCGSRLSSIRSMKTEGKPPTAAGHTRTAILFWTRFPGWVATTPCSQASCARPGNGTSTDMIVNNAMSLLPYLHLGNAITDTFPHRSKARDSSM